jgi:neuraminyllactose-binding hemagglutinin
MKLLLKSAVFIALIILIGCYSTEIPVNKKVGVLSFEHPNIKQKPKTKYTIAIVTSELKGFEDKNALFSPGSLIISKSSDLQTAFNRTFMEIVTKEGFTTKGPYETFDEMSPLDKTNVYLAIIPQLNFNVVKSSIASAQKDLYYTEKGTLTVTGEFYMKLVEPVSNQALINRRINLTDFKLSKNYVYESQTSIKQAIPIVYSVYKSMDPPDSLSDDTDKVVSDLLNEFYAKSVEKIVQYLSREELLSIEKEVQNLKGRKVY